MDIEEDYNLSDLRLSSFNQGNDYYSAGAQDNRAQNNTTANNQTTYNNYNQYEVDPEPEAQLFHKGSVSGQSNQYDTAYQAGD